MQNQYKILMDQDPFEDEGSIPYDKFMYLWKLVVTAEKLIESRVKTSPGIAIRLFKELQSRLPYLKSNAGYIYIVEYKFIDKYLSVLEGLSAFIETEIDRRDDAIHEAIAEREMFQQALTGTKNAIDELRGLVSTTNTEDVGEA